MNDRFIEVTLVLDRHRVQCIQAAGGDIATIVQNTVDRALDQWIWHHFNSAAEHERRSRAGKKGAETRRNRMAELR